MADKLILVVDDERDFLKIISSRIESWGYKVISVSSGSDAITLIKDKKPDIVILDYMMPEMDGIATLKKIRHIDKKLPVIMFTAYPNETTMISSRNCLSVSANVIIESILMFINVYSYKVLNQLRFKI